MGHANGSIQRFGNPHVMATCFGSRNKVYCTSPQVKRNENLCVVQSRTRQKCN